MEKVTRPDKIVTDPLVLKELVRQGIDPEYVEFSQDYAARSLGKSPYAKFYRDLKSNKRIMVVSGLPMVDGDGQKVDAGWSDTPVKFKSKNNLFQASVNGLDVEIVVRNDQPDGRKKNDRLTCHAQLFLDGVEQLPVSDEAILLPVDPTNENYNDNVLEWDFGICKRRLRLIESRLIGSWVFPANPNGEVLIRYNQTGDYRLKLGQFATDDDTETVAPGVFDNPEEYGLSYPIVISDSSTFYPDAGVNSVDGKVAYLEPEVAWSTAKNHGGNSSGDTGANGIAVYRLAGTTSTKWRWLYRGILLFDTSGLPDGVTIDTAVLSIYGRGKSGVTSISVNVYSSNPASDTALVDGDFDSLGASAFSDPITRNNWDITDYNDFVLNSTGRSAISKTGVSKFGTRDPLYDVTGDEPPWVAANDVYLLDYKTEEGAGKKPKLVVTFTVPSITGSVTLTGTGSLSVIYSGNLKHKDIGTELTRIEWGAPTAHVLEGQAKRDMIYAKSTTVLARIPAGERGIPGASIVVAASNSMPSHKRIADYVCDGTNDDVEIQAALDALTLGGTVLLLEGTYNLTAQINITYDNTTLTGVGFATILKVMSSLGTVLQSTRGNVTLSKFQLDGNQGSYTLSKGIVAATNFAPYYVCLEELSIHDCIKPIQLYVQVNEKAHGIVRGCHIYDCTDGLDAHHAGIYTRSIVRGKAIITNNAIYNIGDGTIYGHGIFIEAAAGSPPGNTIVTNNIIDKVVDNGIEVDRQHTIIIKGNIIKNGISSGEQNGGIYATGDATYDSHNVIIADNLIYDDQATPTQKYGIYLSGGDALDLKRYTVTSNVIYNMLRDGMYIYGAEDCVVANNIIYDNDVNNTTTYHGIRLTGSCERMFIHGNKIRDNDNYEISIESGCTDNVIINNDLRGADHVGTVSDSGTGTTNRDNIV